MAEKKKFVFAERKRALQMAATCGLSVIEEKAELRGYQIYVVEQWVCDRKVPSNVVKVFTGDNNHVIQVAVIAISTAELQHPRPQIQSFLDVGAHLKSKPTPLGEILLTNPGELPYDMDMILVPNGDYDRWIKQAYVNINLRRTNCTGRSSLNLQPPNPASEEKFRSLYKIADTVNFQDAVINLVSLVQIALYLFKLLDKDYIDGLLCDETTRALWAFYTKYNPVKTTEFSLKEPWMEPHLVAAIISKLVICRNKLQDVGFTTVKDPFIDYDTFRFDIGDYQKYKNMRVTRFLDMDTVLRLNEQTNPIHSLVGQMKVKRVIKSKLDDISGATNSPLSIETSDPEAFRHHATIESLRAIWRPKQKGGLYTTLSSNNNDSSGMTSLISEISNSNNNSDQQLHGTLHQQQHHDQSSPAATSNELIHMLKKTTKTGGAAVDMLKNRVAGSFPWINTTSDSKSKPTSPLSSGIEITSPVATSIPSPRNHQQHESASLSSSSDASKAADNSTPKLSRKPSPLFIQTSPPNDTSALLSPPLVTASTSFSRKRIPSLRRNNKMDTSVEHNSNISIPSNNSTTVSLTSPVSPNHDESINIAITPASNVFATHPYPMPITTFNNTGPRLRMSKSADTSTTTLNTPQSAPIVSPNGLFTNVIPPQSSVKSGNENELDIDGGGKRESQKYKDGFTEEVSEKNVAEAEEHLKKTKERKEEEGGDFVPYIPEKKHQKQIIFKRYGRTRSISDSILFDPAYMTAADLPQQQPKQECSQPIKESDLKSVATIDKKKRSNTVTLGKTKSDVIDMDDLIFSSNENLKDKTALNDRNVKDSVQEQQQQRPKTIMNVQTYLTFQRLLKQQRQLEQTYQQVKSIATIYEKTAERLKQTFERRVRAFEHLQTKSKQVMDEQSTTAQKLKQVEDHSAKLHYELNVLNDKLKEIEENVGTFFGKVGVLERKMDVSAGGRSSPSHLPQTGSPSGTGGGDASASTTTLMIVGNYFNHYWTKIYEWMSWLQLKKEQTPPLIDEDDLDK